MSILTRLTVFVGAHLVIIGGALAIAQAAS